MGLAAQADLLQTRLRGRERERDHSGRRPKSVPPLFSSVEQIVLPLQPCVLDSSGQDYSAGQVCSHAVQKNKARGKTLVFVNIFFGPFPYCLICFAHFSSLSSCNLSSIFFLCFREIFLSPFLILHALDTSFPVFTKLKITLKKACFTLQHIYILCGLFVVAPNNFIFFSSEFNITWNMTFVVQMSAFSPNSLFISSRMTDVG